MLAFAVQFLRAAAQGIFLGAPMLDRNSLKPCLLTKPPNSNWIADDLPGSGDCQSGFPEGAIPV